MRTCPPRWIWLALLVIALTSVGCASHGDSTSGVLPVSGASRLVPTKTVPTTLTMHLTIPRASSAPAMIRGKRPLYLSPNTESISVSVATINGATPSPTPTADVVTLNSASCSGSGTSYTCSVSLLIPASINKFSSGSETVGVSIATYGTLNGTGTALSETTTPVSVTLTQGTTNAAVNIVLSGNDSVLVIPSQIVVPWTGAYAESGVSFTVSAHDASGAAITGSSYVNAVTVSASALPSADTITFSPTSIPSPSTTSGATTVTATLSDYVTSSPWPTPSAAEIIVKAGSVSASATIVPMITTNASGSPAPPAVALATTTLFGNASESATIGVEEPGYGGGSQGYTVSVPFSQMNTLTTTCHDTSCIPSSGSPEYITITSSSTSFAPATPVPVTVTDTNGNTVTIPVTGVSYIGSSGSPLTSCTSASTTNVTSGLNSEIFLEPHISGVVYMGPSHPCIFHATTSGSAITTAYYTVGCNGGSGYLQSILYGRWEFDNSPYTVNGGYSNEAWGQRTNGALVLSDASQSAFSSGTSPSCTTTGSWQTPTDLSQPLDFLFNPNGSTQSTWSMYALSTGGYSQYTINQAYADVATMSTSGGNTSSAECTQSGDTLVAGVFDNNDGTYGSVYSTGQSAFYRCALTSATGLPSTATKLLSWSGTIYPAKIVQVGTSTLAISNTTGNQLVLYTVNNGAGTGTAHYVTVPSNANAHYVVPSVAADPNGIAVWATVRDTTDNIGGICRIDITTFYQSCFTLSTGASTTYFDDLGFDSSNYLYASEFSSSAADGNLQVLNI